MNRREFLHTGTALAATPALSLADAPKPGGETLYNGIKLSTPWPPAWKEVPANPSEPPYLVSPPAVIPIDLGRQLLVDDFLIEKTDLKRTFHAPKPHKDTPVLKPEKPWEREGASPMAMVFSDGVWYDPADKLFKMWYMGGYGRSVCLAYSEDGVRWTRPALDVKKGTNLVHPGLRDSSTIWLDHETTDPKQRYKMFLSHSEGGRFGQSVYYSADGIHWGDRLLRTGSTGDRTTAFFNPFRKVWVYSLRHGWGVPRRRRYWETPDLVKGPQWEKIDEPGMWIGSDSKDPQRDDLKIVPQLYNLDCVAYESLVLGLFSIWRGDLNIPPGRPKPNNVCAGFSRDGFPLVPTRQACVYRRLGNEGRLELGQRAVGRWLLSRGEVVVKDELYFYHSGRAGSPGAEKGRDGGGSTGLAVLRRDGFASLDADDKGGTLTTRPVKFTGQHLFVNADADGGELVAEVTDENGKVLDGLSAAECIAVQADKTKQAIVWKAGSLAAAAGKPVRFRFRLKSASLFAFWVSKEKTGASNGFVAAGGPGLTNRDA